jgi:hypothetical protein
MAWLGGGSMATGGLGIAGGTVVLWTGIGLVGIGVTAAVMYGFHAAAEHEDNIRLSKTIEYLSAKKTFPISSEQSFNTIR